MILFMLFINKLNKNHFSILHNYKITKSNDKPYHINYNVNNEYLKKANKSNYCLDLIMDMKDGTILELFNTFSKCLIYSYIIQLIYTLYLIHSNGYTHNDLNLGNIMYTKTKKKYINILNLSVPTMGYIFSIIDYGNILL